MSHSQNLESLLEFCGVGTAEGESALLTRVYVTEERLPDLVLPARGSPRLIVGKKGTGKSALLQFASRVFGIRGLPCLVIKPMDIALPEADAHAPVGSLARSAREAILNAVAAELGKAKSGLLSPEKMVLYESAVKDGSASRDLVGTLARLVPGALKPFHKADFDGLFKETAQTAIALQGAIADDLRQGPGTFCLFIDDVDQVANFAAPGHLNRVWSVLLAAREITRIGGVRIVIAIREEVWRRLLRDEAGQRDQADHFIPLVRELSPTRTHIAAVIARRLEVAASDAGIRLRGSPYQPFFQGEVARMPGSEEVRSWQDLIVLRARERPRDAIQLIGRLARRALEKKSEKITGDDLSAVIPEFSSQQVTLLAQEAESECPQIREVVESFAGLNWDQGAFKLSAGRMRTHLAGLPTAFGTVLYGRALQPGNDRDLFELWKYLFDLGIVNARVADDREKDEYRHILPREDPTLVSVANWANMEGLAWEINPAYRDHLLTRRDREVHRPGLPPRRRPR